MANPKTPKTPVPVDPEDLQPAAPEVVSINQLKDAFVSAMEAAKPKVKKTPTTRVSKTPWSPPPGEAKLKLKRKAYQHGIEEDGKKLTNEEISLFNQLRPGTFLDGFVKVSRRRDKGINIEYPIQTPAQRMKLASVYGITSLSQLLKRCIDEAERKPSFSSPDLD